MAGRRKRWEIDEDDNEEAEPDLRPAWELQDPRQGLDPWDALYHFVDKVRATEVYLPEKISYEVEGFDDPMWSAEERQEHERASAIWRSKLSDLTYKLRQKLIRGEVVARGYSNQSPIDGPKQTIAPERWHDLELILGDSAASGPGLEITQVQIFPATNDQTRVSTPQSKGPASAALRRWYVKRVEACRKSGRMPTREDDYREANEAFPGNVPRRRIEALRRELAPSSWTRKGRRPVSSS